MVQEFNTSQLELMKSDRAWYKRSMRKGNLLIYRPVISPRKFTKGDVIKGDLYMGKYSPGRVKD